MLTPTPTRPARPSPFDALANQLARGDEISAELVEAIVTDAGRTMRELSDAVAEAARRTEPPEPRG